MFHPIRSWSFLHVHFRFSSRTDGRKYQDRRQTTNYVEKKQETSRAKWMSNLNSCGCRMIFSKELTIWGISVWKYTAVIKNTWTAASYASDDFMHLCAPKCVKPAIYNITQGHVALSMLNMYRILEHMHVMCIWYVAHMYDCTLAIFGHAFMSALM